MQDDRRFKMFAFIYVQVHNHLRLFPIGNLTLVWKFLIIYDLLTCYHSCWNSIIIKPWACLSIDRIKQDRQKLYKTQFSTLFMLQYLYSLRNSTRLLSSFWCKKCFCFLPYPNADIKLLLNYLEFFPLMFLPETLTKSSNFMQMNTPTFIVVK